MVTLPVITMIRKLNRLWIIVKQASKKYLTCVWLQMSYFLYSGYGMIRNHLSAEISNNADGHHDPRVLSQLLLLSLRRPNKFGRTDWKSLN
jgi:hypothetical protein